MASNIFSRLVPTAGGSGGRPSRSFYDELRGRDDGEIEAGLDLDEENLKHHFHDGDLENAGSLAGVDDSQTELGGAASQFRGAAGRGPQAQRGRQARGTTGRRGAAGGDGTTSRWLSHPVDDDPDNDVPASLLVESHDVEPLLRGGGGPRQQGGAGRQGRHGGAGGPIPGPANRRTRAQWEATQAAQRLHQEETFDSTATRSSGRPKSIFAFLPRGDPRQKALWRWANVSNLDMFLKDVYDYYQGAGIYCILLERVLHLVNVAFVASFLTFLTQCVDYRKIPGSKGLNDIMVPKCMSNVHGLWALGLWIFSFYFIWKLFQYLLDIRRLRHMRDFYEYLLDIRDHDMQTVSWQDVVRQIIRFRDENPKTAANVTQAHREYLGNQSKERLDAHDIANRLMRKENYLIALFNKDILNLSVPVPFVGSVQVFSRTMEWCLMFSVLDFVFDPQGHVNKEFLRADKRGQLSQKLRGRFVFAAVMNLLLAPFVACYLVIVYFFTYYSEYSKNPSAIGSRAYTPLAEWKFREFNELQHLFKERINMSYPFATRYLDQFPKLKTEMAARTISFVAGSFAAVLAVASLLDSELLLTFEITPERSAFFYLTVFTAIWAFARGSVSEDEVVFDPEYALRNVIEYTHYIPDHWQSRLHSDDVKREFGALYKMKLIIFIEEVLSLVLAPLVLLTSLPSCSDQIIDFFREFTIHVDGIGYVCSFAVFDFKKGVGASKQQAGGPAADVRDDYYSTKHGKMAASYYGFLDNYVINPKTGIPGHLPPGSRHHAFFPPPAFPGLNSPTLAAEMYASGGIGPGQAAQQQRTGRARSRQPPGMPQSARTPRFGPAVALPSPMGSILLDPHHQPVVPAAAAAAAASNFGTRSVHRPRPQRGVPEASVIEESMEDDADGKQDDDDIYESANGLGESVWETSPIKNLSRESSGVQNDETETGVLGLIYQYQQAHVNRPGGGVL